MSLPLKASWLSRHPRCHHLAPPAGSKVLHVACGAGGLTKMMASQGMQVVGADVDVEAALRRGLAAVSMAGGAEQARQLVAGSLAEARGLGPFDAVLLLGELRPWYLCHLTAELSFAHGREGRERCSPPSPARGGQGERRLPVFFALDCTCGTLQ